MGGLVLVTGASAGMGAAFARAYAARGHDLALTARRADRLEALAAELSDKHGIRAFAVPADLSVYEAHAPLLAQVVKRGGPVHILVNNAGFGIPQSFTAVPWERQRDFLMTLVMNAVGLAYGVVPAMAAAGAGGIINVASIAALSSGAAGNTLYPAAKSFAVKFSQSLHAELSAKGVKVTAILPGFTRTEFQAAAGMETEMAGTPRLFWQSAETVVETAIRANEGGRAVVVPGWHNTLAAALFKYLPEGITGPLIRKGAEKYRVD